MQCFPLESAVGQYHSSSLIFFFSRCSVNKVRATPGSFKNFTKFIFSAFMMRSETPSSKKIEGTKCQEQERVRVGYVVLPTAEERVVSFCCLRGAVSPNTHHPLMQIRPFFYNCKPDIPELWHGLSKLPN